MQRSSHGSVKTEGVGVGERKRACAAARTLTGTSGAASMPLRSGLRAFGRAGHLCALYETRQECADIVKVFLEMGIAGGARCLCLVSSGSEKVLRRELRAANPRIARALAAKTVDLTTIERAYASHAGLIAERALDFWRNASEQAANEGFSGLRGIVQVERILGGPTVRARWLEYEYSLTQVLAQSGGTLLCLYRVLPQPMDFVRDAFRAHAIVTHRGWIGQNIFYVPSEECAARDKGSCDVHRMLVSLGARWRAQARTQKRDRRLSEALQSLQDQERVIQGLTNELRQHEQNEQPMRRYLNYLTLGQQLTSTGSWAWNCSSRELFWSREHFRIFGLDPTRTKMSYQLFFQMVHPEERVRVEQQFLEAVRGKRDFDGEYRITRPDGYVRQIHSRAQPVFGDAGELTEYIGTVVDITERRHGEESIGSMQAELARASRAMTLVQLMASIAHEVNQPLAALVANANAGLRWLEWEEPRTDKARQALSRVITDGNRASEIIARIRALVRKTDVQHEPLSLNSLVHEVVALLRTELRLNNVSVQVDLAEPLAPIRGDRVQMQQVLLNLIMNAIEAMATVTAQPRLLAVTTRGDASAVELSVKDCGIGLDKGVLERIFEPFYSDKPDGMGMGLAISRAIINEHGGRLWVTRNKVAGAKFHFRLPVAGVDPT